MLVLTSWLVLSSLVYHYCYMLAISLLCYWQAAVGFKCFYHKLDGGALLEINDTVSITV